MAGCEREDGMNAAVFQLTAHETKRPEKLLKLFKTSLECSEVKLDSLALIALLNFVNVISVIANVGFSRAVCLSRQVRLIV